MSFRVPGPGLVVLAWCLLATTAFAGKPAVVLSGPPAVTKLVSKELSKKYTPKTATAPVSPMPTAKEVRDATQPAQAVALVLCQAAGQLITLQVLSGHDGTPLDTVTVKGSLKKLPKTLPKAELAPLVFAIGQGKAPGKEPKAAPPPVDTPKKEEPVVETKKEEKKPVAEVKKEEPKKEAPPPKEEAKVEESALPTSVAVGSEGNKYVALRVGVGAGGFNRSFAWQGNPSPSLATANQPFSGNLSVDASWFPGAHFTSNFLSGLGVFLTGDFGLGMVSRVQESRFAHSASRLRFGALVRFSLGDRVTPFLHVGYARQELTTSLYAINDASVRPNIPDVLFNGFRGGVGVRLRIVGTVELDVVGGFMSVAGKGELGSDRYFPQATAIAADAGGGVSVEIAPHLRLRGGAEWQRFFVTLNAADSSTFFARTASDQYITATARLEWAL